jgi:hypothetical protein
MFRIHGGLSSDLAIAYSAVLPSFVAYLFFSRVPGLQDNLLFGSLLAVLFLHEELRIYHAAGVG